MALNLIAGKLREPAECVITINGVEIDNLYPFLVEATVDMKRNEAAQSTLVFDSRMDEKGIWPLIDESPLRPWAEVRIDAAFGGYTEEVFRGYILKVSPSFPENAGTSRVTILCQDESLKLDRNHVRTAWGGDVPTSDLTVLTQILLTNSLIPHPDSVDGQKGISLNQNGTDIRFLKTRAQSNGYELIFHSGLVYFGPMRLDKEPQERILVYAGSDTNCINFEIDDDGHRPDAVAFDISNETSSGVVSETFESELAVMGTEPATRDGSGLKKFEWRLTHGQSPRKSEAAAQARGRAEENAMSIRATGELNGSLYGHVLRIAEPVEVDGIGRRYGGVWYVDAAVHRFDGNGYQQSFELIRNAYGDTLGTIDNVLSAVL